MFRIIVWAVGAILATIALVFLSRDLLPPDRVTFAAGAEGGGYSRLAMRYRSILARDGIEVTVLETEGSVENARLLADGVADIGLLQGGVVPEAPLETLGAVFLEPMFVFVRTDAPSPRNIARWRELVVAAGSEGSGTRAAVEALISAATMDPRNVRLTPVGGARAADAILDGSVDVAIFVAPVGAPYLEPLFVSEQVEIASLDHLVTLSRRLPDSLVTTLPSGAFSLDPPMPRREVMMLTLVANLVAQPDLHPALVDRLVEAAKIIHGPRDILSEDGEFPSMGLATLPKNAYARDLIEDGPNPLRRFLPYWVVAQISRFAILLLPILFIVLPLLRALPGLYVWRQRRRVFRHYAAIRSIDAAASSTTEPAELHRLAEHLDRIDAEIAHLDLPPPYREHAYTARLHIDLIRRRIAELLVASGEAPDALPKP
jgi:TRAP-type uncharacterized transport system substrate-binding protein